MFSEVGSSVRALWNLFSFGFVLEASSLNASYLKTQKMSCKFFGVPLEWFALACFYSINPTIGL